MAAIKTTDEVTLDQVYNGDFYTIAGCGGSLEEWVNGYNDMLKESGIGTPEYWVTFKGKEVNRKYGLKGDNRFKSDLNFLAFPHNTLNVGKLAMFKLQNGDRWFRDIISNSR